MVAEKIGFVGLGEMGKPMAINLVKKGFSVTVYDMRPEPLAELKQLGATVANSLKEMAEASDFIITMVRDVPQTEGIIFGKSGIWEGLREGATIIITSTLDPFFCQSLEEKAKTKKVGVLDACVSGAKPKAESGSLTLMAGGDEKVYKRCLPILEAMGKEIYFLGGVGAGQITKLANNMMLHINMAGATESIALAVAGGIKLETFLDVVKKSTGNSWVVENWALISQKKRELREGKPDATFKNSLNLMDAALRMGRNFDLHLPFIGLVSQIDEGNGPFSRIEAGNE